MRTRSRRIRPRSARVLEQLPLRARVVDDAWERDRGECRVALIVREHLMGRLAAQPDSEEIFVSLRAIGCRGRLDPHERIPRSAWPGGELELENVMLICRQHHRWVDANPAAAHLVGLHGFSWERPR